MTYAATRNVISSPGSADGPTQLDWLDGPMTGPSGPVAAPANRSRSRAKAQVSTIHGICGPTSFDSSKPVGLPLSWESRLAARLAMVGSTESALIWREKGTPAGRSIFRLAPWTPPISERGSIGSQWPTPKASNAGPDFAKVDRSATGLSLQTVMAQSQSLWPTVSGTEGGQTSRGGDRKNEPLLGGLMAQASPWVTPNARDWKDCGSMATVRKDGKGKIDQTPRQMMQTALTAHGGAALTGSSATTARRAGSPTPAHPCWLMGYPAVWLYLAPSISQVKALRAKAKGK